MKWKVITLITMIVSFESVTVFGQQNYFNVPSSNITEKGKVFIQEQLNFFPSSVASNLSVSYGLGKKFEVGVNYLGLTYDFNQGGFISNDDNQTTVFPSIGLNMQKNLIGTKHYEASLGGQILFPSEIKETEYYAYLNNKLEFDHFNFVGGLYTGNSYYFGHESKLANNVKNFGFQLGAEFEVINNKLFFQTDYLSGKTALSNWIIGGAYKISKAIFLSGGDQIPDNIKVSSKGVILEFTYNP